MIWVISSTEYLSMSIDMPSQPVDPVHGKLEIINLTLAAVTALNENLKFICESELLSYALLSLGLAWHVLLSEFILTLTELTKCMLTILADALCKAGELLGQRRKTRLIFPRPVHAFTCLHKDCGLLVEHVKKKNRLACRVAVVQ